MQNICDVCGRHKRRCECEKEHELKDYSYRSKRFEDQYEELSYECNKCKQSFDSKYLLIRHKKEKHFK